VVGAFSRSTDILVAVLSMISLLHDKISLMLKQGK